jgi:hypothetical protein
MALAVCLVSLSRLCLPVLPMSLSLFRFLFLSILSLYLSSVSVSRLSLFYLLYLSPCLLSESVIHSICCLQVHMHQGLFCVVCSVSGCVVFHRVMLCAMLCCARLLYCALLCNFFVSYTVLLCFYFLSFTPTSLCAFFSLSISTLF